MIGFYVSVRRADQWRPLLGPFDTKEQAEEKVSEGQKLAIAYDAKCCFDFFGVVKITANNLPKPIFPVDNHRNGP